MVMLGIFKIAIFNIAQKSSRHISKFKLGFSEFSEVKI